MHGFNVRLATTGRHLRNQLQQRPSQARERRGVQLAAGGAVLLQSLPRRPAIWSSELTPSATLIWV